MTNKEFIIENNILFSDALKMHEDYCSLISSEWRNKSTAFLPYMIPNVPSFDDWLNFEYNFKPKFKVGDIFIATNGTSDRIIRVIVDIDEKNQKYIFSHFGEEVDYREFNRGLFAPRHLSWPFKAEKHMKKIGTLD